MSLRTVSLPKRYKNSQVLFEQNLDAWRQATESAFAELQLNLTQIRKDCFLTNYDYDNDGQANLGSSLQEQINLLSAGGTPITGTTSDSFTVNTDGNGSTLSTAGLTATRTFTWPDTAGEQLVKEDFQLSVGQTYNLGITFTANVLSMTQEDGASLAVRAAYVGVPSITAGQAYTAKITANQTINSAAHATPQILGRFGTTASIAWASAMPIYLYIVNKDDTDANIRFFLSRKPNLKTTPASTNNIGVAGTPPSSSADGNIVLFGTGSNSGYNSKPCFCLGSVTGTIDNSVGGSMTIGALTAGTHGIGFFQEDVEFTFPTNQNGAESGKVFTTQDGATALTFSTISQAKYYIKKIGRVVVLHSHDNQSVAGADGTSVRWFLPMAVVSSTNAQFIGPARAIMGNQTSAASVFASNGNYYCEGIYANNGANGFTDDSAFSNTADLFYCTLEYLI